MLKVFSYGGGVQSTAALVLAAQRKIDYQTFLFCNVGEDSENPDTLSYVEQVARPFAGRHGLSFHELSKQRRDGSVETIYGRLTRPGSRSIGIPVRMSNGAPGRRSCTVDFKIGVVERWIKDQTAPGLIHQMKEALVLASGVGKIDKETLPLILPTIDSFFREHDPAALVGLGITLDEIERVKPNLDPASLAWKVNAHPLLFEVQRPLTRQDCLGIITDAGLPIPPKSSCWFCPYHSLRLWQQMRDTQPALFGQAVALERLINERRLLLGKDQVWFSSRLKPLDQATTEYVQGTLFEEDSLCESGYCFV